jgi:hypothetical protein
VKLEQQELVDDAYNPEAGVLGEIKRVPSFLRLFSHSHHPITPTTVIDFVFVI